MQQMVQSPAAQHTPPHQMQQQQQQQIRAPTPRELEKMKREAEELEQEQLASLMECRSPREGDAPHSPPKISLQQQQSICNTIEHVVEKVLGEARNGDGGASATATTGKGNFVSDGRSQKQVSLRCSAY